MEIRPLIIAEMIRRLDSYFKFPVKRGFGGMNVSKFPAIYVFEDDEYVKDAASDAITTARHRGVFNRTLPIIIEYFKKGKNATDLYDTGNQMLIDIAKAVELDVYFQNLDKVNLVTGYYQKGNSIIPLRDGVVEVAVQYNFLYPARHLGFN